MIEHGFRKGFRSGGGGGGDCAIARIRSSCTLCNNGLELKQTKKNSLLISLAISSLSVKSLCKSMQLDIEPFLCHC